MKIWNRGKSSLSQLKLLGFISILVAVGTLLFFIPSSSTDDHPPVEAPLNPEFLEYLEMKEQGLIRPMYTAEGYPLGLIPSPHDIDYPEDVEEQDEGEIAALPKTYNLRTRNKLTVIKNQGQCGSCWAFATYGALESSLLMAESSLRIKEVCDFSEQHLITKHGFKGGPCEGGTIDQAVAYLARGDGPIDESDLPYVYSSSISALDVKKQIQDVIYFPERKNATDNSLIKKAIQRYGAVYSGMRYNSSRYNPINTAYYNPDLDEGSHAVNIVGWDDTFRKEYFIETPPGDGAFIVRNSWGTDWGDNGYFYISYHDAFLAMTGWSAAFDRTVDASTYSEIYQYDPSGWVTRVGYPPSNTAWFANIFKAKSNHSLKAVSFYALGKTNTYKIYVYTGVRKNQPRSGTLKTQKSGRFKSPGYYTVDIGEVPLSKGNKFSVVVMMKSKGNEYPIAYERHIKGYTLKKNSKGKKGESFISYNGDDWTDLYSWRKKSNVCLKGFVK